MPEIKHDMQQLTAIFKYTIRSMVKHNYLQITICSNSKNNTTALTSAALVTIWTDFVSQSESFWKKSKFNLVWPYTVLWYYFSSDWCVTKAGISKTFLQSDYSALL